MARNNQLDSEILSKFFDGIESGNSHLVVKIDMSGDKLKIIEEHLQQRLKFIINNTLWHLEKCSTQADCIREKCYILVDGLCGWHVAQSGHVTFPDGNYTPNRVRPAVIKAIEDVLKERKEIEDLIKRYHEVVLKILLKNAQ